MSRKEGTPDRSGEEPEHNEVVHFQEIAARNANHVLDIGASLGARRVALGFHVTWFETAMICGGRTSTLRDFSFLPIGKRGVRACFCPCFRFRSNLRKRDTIYHPLR